MLNYLNAARNENTEFAFLCPTSMRLFPISNYTNPSTFAGSDA